MSELPAHTAQSLEAAIRDDGFAFVDHAATRTLLERFGGLDDWDGFVASWNGLGVDTYLAATGRPGPVLVDIPKDASGAVGSACSRPRQANR